MAECGRVAAFVSHVHYPFSLAVAGETKEVPDPSSFAVKPRKYYIEPLSVAAHNDTRNSRSLSTHVIAHLP